MRRAERKRKRPDEDAARLGLVIARLAPPVALADSYTGVVSEIKYLKNSAIAVDLDGNYPHEKSELYIPADNAAKISSLPPEGVKVTAIGTLGSYKGTPEIRIYSSDQWKW